MDYTELVTELRDTERICRDRMDGEVMLRAADAIEELVRLRNTAEENRIYWEKRAVEYEVAMHIAQGKGPHWIPVTERLPKDHERVLVCNDDGKMMVAKRAEDDWWHYYCAYDVDRWWTGENGKIVAWTPLPEPPWMEERNGKTS